MRNCQARACLRAPVIEIDQHTQTGGINRIHLIEVKNNVLSELADHNFLQAVSLGAAHNRSSTAVNGDFAQHFAFNVQHRSEAHTSELQSHSFISYAVFC